MKSCINLLYEDLAVIEKSIISGIRKYVGTMCIRLHSRSHIIKRNRGLSYLSRVFVKI